MKLYISLALLTGACLSEDSPQTKKIAKDSAEFVRMKDGNKDGKLSFAEYTADIVAHDKERIRKSIQEEFRKSDINSDGFLSLDEITSPRVAWFKCADKDGDGNLSNSELSDTASCSDVGLSTDESSKDVLSNLK